MFNIFEKYINFKIKSKFQIRNNLYFKNNTTSNNQDLTSINKSNY